MIEKLIRSSNGCKKRKIKCDGGETCQRCAQLGVQCVYTPGGGDGGLSTMYNLHARMSCQSKHLADKGLDRG